MSQHRSPSLAADAGVVRNLDGKLQILMVTRGHAPYQGCLAFPGGFVEYGEDPKDGCLRELKEETNLDASSEDIKLVGVYGSPTRDPRKHVVSIFYLVQVSSLEELKGGDDAADAHFYDLEYLQSNPTLLAFDHAKLLEDLVSVLKKA